MERLVLDLRSRHGRRPVLPERQVRDGHRRKRGACLRCPRRPIARRRPRRRLGKRPAAGPGVADARCPTGYKLVGGGWGTRNAVADGADVFDYTGGNPPGGGEGTGGPDAYDVGAASLLGGTVYARAYCIKLN